MHFWLWIVLSVVMAVVNHVLSLCFFLVAIAPFAGVYKAVQWVQRRRRWRARQ